MSNVTDSLLKIETNNKGFLRCYQFKIELKCHNQTWTWPWEQSLVYIYCKQQCRSLNSRIISITMFLSFIAGSLLDASCGWITSRSSSEKNWKLFANPHRIRIDSIWDSNGRHSAKVSFIHLQSTLSQTKYRQLLQQTLIYHFQRHYHQVVSIKLHFITTHGFQFWKEIWIQY